LRAVHAPSLNSAQQAQLQHTLNVIRGRIAEAGGRLPFDRFMETALYAPGAGYYVNGTRKFGAAGDFVTAPEISSLFSHCLANQCAQVLGLVRDGCVLEFGAGSGAMAADILARLQVLDRLPQRYQIIELSPELQQRQRETLQRRVPDLLGRVEWLERLPSPGWRGVILGNELLDAMPVHRFRRTAQGWEELLVGDRDGGLQTLWGAPVSDGLVPALDILESRVGALAPGYSSEINLRLGGWMKALAEVLQQGVLLLIDYGYSEREYYHPQRHDGTLICHFQHRAHDDPLCLPGLQDITANVDFSAVAHAALDAGLSLAGYTTQGNFLINSGLQMALQSADSEDAGGRVDRLQQVKQLTLPSEMGERFKAIAFCRDLALPLQGFTMGDLRVYL
jgi:SAM-dependent MidA family methyltransferase